MAAAKGDAAPAADASVLDTQSQSSGSDTEATETASAVSDGIEDSDLGDGDLGDLVAADLDVAVTEVADTGEADPIDSQQSGPEVDGAAGDSLDGDAASAAQEVAAGQDSCGDAAADSAGDATEVVAAPEWLGVCPPDPKPGLGAPMPAIGYPVPGVGCAKKGWPTPPEAMPPLWTDLTTAVGMGSLGLVDTCLIWHDLTGDGRPDLVVSEQPLSPTAKRTLRTYEWTDSGPWPVTKLTLPASINITDCNPVDFDNDGDVDIAMGTSSGLRMVLNAFGKFIDAPASAVPDQIKGTMTWSSATVDFDRDGDQDLYVARTGVMSLMPGQFECFPYDTPNLQCCYGSGSMDTTCASAKISTPMDAYQCCTQFPPGATNLLLRKGVPSMELVPLVEGCTDPGATLVVATHDANRDGWPDILAGDDFGPLGWYRIFGDGTCSYHGKTAGLLPYGHNMGVAVADFDLDGLVDLFQGDVGSVNLYRGVAGGGFTHIPSWGGAQTLKDSVAWTQLAGDFDNDGWTDVWSLTSMSAQPGKLKQALDAKVPLPLLAPGFHVFFHNHGSNFAPIQHPWPNSKEQNIAPVAMAAADMEGDGDLDVVYTSPSGDLRLLRNDAQPGRHWLDFELVRDVSALGGIGAKIQVWAQGYVQEREVSWSPGGGGHGTFSGHVGLGGVAKVDQVVVWWPSGRVSLLGPQAVDQTVMVLEADAKVKAGGK